MKKLKRLLLVLTMIRKKHNTKINSDDVIERNIFQNDHKFMIFHTDYNNWRLWIWKKKLLFTLTVCQADIDKIYLCDKDPYEAK